MFKKNSITQGNSLELLKKIPDKSIDLVFADPPYDIKSFIYGNKGDMHISFSHKDFHDCVDASSNMVMITYNSNDELKDAYSNWKQKEWDLTYTMVSTKKYRDDEHNRKELLLVNYEQNQPTTLEAFFG